MTDTAWIGSSAGPEFALPPEHVIFGRSAAMARVRRTVEAIASANVPILILGESGTGKEVLAKEIHRNSPRAKGPFVKVSCPAIPGTLLESELFGYEKGAFTGAQTSRVGRVEQAHQGILFLDEIAELDTTLQAKLLHLLQDGQFCRVGDREQRQVDVHFISSTNRNLEEEIAAGGFRQDLYFRINVIGIEMPPLRQRAEDVPLLVDYFLNHYSVRYGRPAEPLSASVLQTLQRHTWPGNIRELENAVKRYVILGTEDAVLTALAHGPEQAWLKEIPENEMMPLKQLTRQAVREVERSAILRVLHATRWNRRKAAKILQISYRALLYKIRDCGLPTKRASALRNQAPDSSPDAEERK